MQKYRIHPGAVARQLLDNLKTYEPLSPSEEASILDAIKSTGIDQSLDRVMATLARGTIKQLLTDIETDRAS